MFLAFFLCLTALPLPAMAETEETTAETTLEATTEAPSEPSEEPTTEPSTEPAAEPSTEPSSEPTTEPTTEATTESTTEPTIQPSTEPVTEPTQEETTLPTETQLETVAPVTIDPIGGHLPANTPVTLSCATEEASIYYALSYDGETYSEYYQYIQPLLPEADFSCFCVKAYAVKMGLPDGLVTEAIFTGTPRPKQTEDGWNYYFGQLHHHSTLSGEKEGRLSPEETYLQAAQAENMDFFAITDHSHSFDGTPSTDLTVPGTGDDWLSGKAAAAAVTNENFVGIWGYELSWQDDLYFGHMSTFATEGFASRNQPEFSNFATGLDNYYSSLAAANAIGQFNHPSLEYSFQNFSHYSPQADAAMTLLELPESMDCQYYHQALLSGWHLAPTFGGSNGRTVILSNTLTEDAIYEALRSRSAYATQDLDFSIDFRLNDAPMGSILHSADAANITVSLSDPTDTGTATVTVITNTQSATQTIDLSTEESLLFQLPATDEFYYIQALQPDGDIAVTAPVWIRQPEDWGISGLSCDTALPVQGQPLNITLELYNNETLDFTTETIEFYIGDTKIHTMPAMTVAPGRAETCTFSYTHLGLGITPIRAEVTTTINGEKRQFSQELPLRFHLPQQISTICVDGFYSQISAANLQNLTALAAKSDIITQIHTQELTAQDLQNTGLVILPAPKSAYSDAFLQNLTEFIWNGGNLILCGQSNALDHYFDSAAETNRLLSHLGASMRLLPGTVTDEEHNGGVKDHLYPTVSNPSSPWCDQIDDDQFYVHRSGCAVDPGQGEWLIKGFPTTFWGETAEPVLSARETTVSGGTILLCGSFFLKDTDMPLPKNQWDPPRINQSFLMKLLKIEENRVELPLSTIRAVRNGAPGEVYRIQGTVTAGTSNPYNAFPGTLYLQDETGGIAVVPFTETGIPKNARMEIIGYLEEIQGNTVLSLIDDTLITKTDKAIDPRTIPNKEAMDYEKHGGELLQIEGTAISITYTANQKGVTRFTLKDKSGDLATVLVESYIGSGSSGENILAEKVLKGKTARVRGILHRDSSGANVLRVRNCDEVIYVPPAVTPNTGDQIHTSLTILALSSLGLILAFLFRKKT